MNRRIWQAALVAVCTLALFGTVVIMAQGPAQPGGGQLQPLQAGPDEPSISARVAYTYTSVITVTSGTDPDDSKSRTCLSEPVCTLRRAIVQARNLGASELPVLIRFDIPQDPAEGYDSSLQVWKIEVYPTLETSIFRRLTGQIIIDGATQPNGRANGPKIIIAGPGTGQKDGPIVGDIAGDDEIVIRGLAFQNLKTHMYVNTNDNLIEDNWFGLDDDGLRPFLRDDNPEDGSGNAGISFNGNPTNNVVRANAFLGFDGVAVAVRGEDNQFVDNLVGTRADGSVSKQTEADLVCTTVDWLGGGGVSVAGEANRIENNVFAALRQEIFEISTQPDAIRLDGDRHVVQGNEIGIDGTGAEVGVCGRAVYLAGANDPDHTLVLSNTIMNPGMSAISINGPLVDADRLQNNTIEKSTPWPAVEGNPVPEDAIQFGRTVPESLRGFKPARVTSIDGTTVTGAGGVDSPCPNCFIELYLDDTDAVTEALQLLDAVTADGSGNWTATLPAELENDQGIRTTSTTARFNTIANMGAGTTTGLSALYYLEDYKLFLPITAR